MKQVTKFGVLLVVLGCSLHGKAASLQGKGGNKSCRGPINSSDLMSNDQNKFVNCNVECIPPSPTPPGLGGNPPPSHLNAGTLTATSVGASASTIKEDNKYHDHQCVAASFGCKEESGCETSAAFGCGCRKRTVCLEGDICYRNIKSADEHGSAAQAKESCEEAITTTTTSLTGFESAVPCVVVSSCE